MWLVKSTLSLHGLVFNVLSCSSAMFSARPGKTRSAEVSVTVNREPIEARDQIVPLLVCMEEIQTSKPNGLFSYRHLLKLLRE